MLEIWTSEFILSEGIDVVMDIDLNMKEMMKYSEIVRLVLKAY